MKYEFKIRKKEMYGLSAASSLFAFLSGSLLFFNVGGLEGLNEIPVHPLADVEGSIHSVLYRQKSMATSGIVEQASLNSQLLKCSVIVVCLMRGHSQVLVADQELGGSGNVLDIGHGRSFEEVDLLFNGHDREVNLFLSTAGVNPVRNVSRVDHVGHIEHGVP